MNCQISEIWQFCTEENIGYWALANQTGVRIVLNSKPFFIAASAGPYKKGLARK